MSGPNWTSVVKEPSMQQNQTTSQNSSEMTLKGFLTQDFSSTQNIAYHELDAVPVREVNELQQLSSNIEMLSNLRSKLQFLNREIRYLMKV